MLKTKVYFNNKICIEINLVYIIKKNKNKRELCIYILYIHNSLLFEIIIFQFGTVCNTFKF